jgi:hypothetical protein
VALMTRDDQGRFFAQDIPPGTYLLKAGSDEIGWIFEDVEIGAGSETQLNERKLIKVAFSYSQEH